MVPAPACSVDGVDRKLLVGAMFAFEVDTLEIALREYDGVADVLVLESAISHNRKDASPKPNLFSTLKATPRFAAFNGHVHAAECAYNYTKTERDDPWKSEHLQNKCLSEELKKLAPAYDVVVVGSVDEILGRDALLRLRHCPLPPLPTSSAIGMPLGLLGRRFKTDWHYASLPKSFSLPTVYASSHGGSFVRSFAPIGATPVMGGLHLSNYCFLPNMVLKDLTATEYGGAVKRGLCTRPLSEWKQSCYRMLSHRVTSGTGEETAVPCSLRESRYPAWFGGVDAREVAFRDALCRRST